MRRSFSEIEIEDKVPFKFLNDELHSERSNLSIISCDLKEDDDTRRGLLCNGLCYARQKDSDILDKLGDKILQIIVVFEGDYKIDEKVFNFLLEIIQAFIDNTKIKIGYIILLNPILEYLINVLKIQVEEKIDKEEKHA